MSTPTPKPAMLSRPNHQPWFQPFRGSNSSRGFNDDLRKPTKRSWWCPRFMQSQAKRPRPSACPASQHPTDPVKDDYPFSALRPINCVNTPSGSLVHILDNWKTITQHNMVLQTVVGYKIPFVAPSRQWRPRVTTTRSSIHTKRMNTAIQKLLAKAAIKEVQPVKNQITSSLFLVMKAQSAGEYRSIINLKPLNRF